MPTSQSAFQQHFVCRALTKRLTDGNVYATSQTPLQGAASPVRAALPTVNPAARQQKLTLLLQLIDELTTLRNGTMDSHGTPQGSYIHHLRVF